MLLVSADELNNAAVILPCSTSWMAVSDSFSEVNAYRRPNLRRTLSNVVNPEDA